MNIRTTFNNDWDSWKVDSDVRMRTTFANDFDQWEIKGHDFSVRVETVFHGDFSRWKISGDAEGEMRTIFSNDYERWDVDIDFGDLPEDMQAAVVFIAIFTSFRRSN